MDRKVIKRFGVNEKGANPNWIIETRLIDKNDITPDGYEDITNYNWKKETKLQAEDFQIWKDAQPKPARNLHLLQDKLAIRVKNKPSECYRLYKYLSSELTKNIDPTLPPHGIDYIISLTPKLEAVRTILTGLLLNVVWYGKYDGLEEEVLKVQINSTLADDAPMPSAQTLLTRTTKRQWIKEDGTYLEDESDVKITTKKYKTLLEQNEEGKRRRNNIFVDLTQDYVTLLTILSTNGDLVAAQDIGKLFLSEVSVDINDYISLGSNVILNTLDSIVNPTYLLDTIVPNL